jgi:Spy/CpxP family protein refolding chaperone
MNKLIVMFFIIFTVAVNFDSLAQKSKMEKRKEMKAKGQEFKDKLKLTDDQMVKLKEIRKKSRDEVKAKLAANPNATKEEKRKIMRSAVEAADIEIMAILTPEQQVIYKQEKEKRKQERIEKMKQNKGKNKGNPQQDKELEDAIMEGL